MSFYLNADPALDTVLIQDISFFVANYLHEAHLGCFYLYPRNGKQHELEKYCTHFYHNDAADTCQQSSCVLVMFMAYRRPYQEFTQALTAQATLLPYYPRKLSR
jgi:hypothetical protein